MSLKLTFNTTLNNLIVSKIQLSFNFAEWQLVPILYTDTGWGSVYSCCLSREAEVVKELRTATCVTVFRLTASPPHSLFLLTPASQIFFQHLHMHIQYESSWVHLTNCKTLKLLFTCTPLPLSCMQACLSIHWAPACAHPPKF